MRPKGKLVSQYSQQFGEESPGAYANSTPAGKESPAFKDAIFDGEVQISEAHCLHSFQAVERKDTNAMKMQNKEDKIENGKDIRSLVEYCILERRASYRASYREAGFSQPIRGAWGPSLDIIGWYEERD